MRAGGDQRATSHQDAQLSRLYQQITDLQVPRFGAGYDLEKGLERYQAWLRAHTGDSADFAAGDGAGLAAAT